MVARIETALVLIAVCLSLIFFAPWWLISSVCVVIAALGQWEFIQTSNLPKWLILGLIAPAALSYFVLKPGFLSLIALTGILLFSVDLWLVGRLQPPTRVVWPLLGSQWIGSAFCLVAILSYLAPTRFPWLMLSILAPIWAGDSAAYFVGRKYGRHKMAPNLSPNKSWEGAIANFCCAAAFGGLIGQMAILPIGVGIGLGAIAGSIGQLGDLFESAWKRHFNVKDSGALLPGHGGILDRVDSLLFTIPVAMVYLAFLGQLPAIHAVGMK